MQFKMDKCKTIHLSSNNLLQKCRTKDEWFCSFIAKKIRKKMHQHPHTPVDKIDTKFRNTDGNAHEGILVL